MKIKLAVIFVIASGLFGCASPARIAQMQVEADPQQRIIETPLRNNVSVKDVTGGQETNPMWTSEVGAEGFRGALEESLKSSGLYAMNQIGKYVLIADLLKVDQPIIGIDMTVTATVRYVVHERASGKNVYVKTIAVPFTAGFSDSVLGVVRLQIANEGAVKVNIKALINDLYVLKLNDVAVN